MRYTLTGSLITHQYVWVDSQFTHQKNVGFVKAVWFGLSSYPARAWGCTIMLESGAIYRNLPPHAISYDSNPPEWSLQQAQRWDCYGWDWTIVEYPYLSSLDCKVHTASNDYYGKYLFSVSPVGDAFSASPDQSKEFTFVHLNNGRLTIQPTNYIIFNESSFTTNNAMAFPRDLKRQEEVYHTEKVKGE